jgi:hypothetical protein
MELIRWRSPDNLALRCTQAPCLITDDTNGESVHSRPD